MIVPEERLIAILVDKLGGEVEITTHDIVAIGDSWSISEQPSLDRNAVTIRVHKS